MNVLVKLKITVKTSDYSISYSLNICIEEKKVIESQYAGFLNFGKGLKKLATKNEKYGVQVASTGFDPVTFGLWAQHASSAPTRCLVPAALISARRARYLRKFYII